MDSSQRVPPMSPCPPLITTMVCPWLINHLSDPWDFNKSNRILLRSNWRKAYPNFYGSELFIIKGWSRNYPEGTPLPTWRGGEINPVLALHGSYGYDLNWFDPILKPKLFPEGIPVSPCLVALQFWPSSLQNAFGRANPGRTRLWRPWLGDEPLSENGLNSMSIRMYQMYLQVRHCMMTTCNLYILYEI